MRDIVNASAEFIVNLVIAVAIGTVFEYYNLSSKSESILIGIMIFVLLTSAEVLYKVNQLRESETYVKYLRNIEDSFDAKLSNIREAYRKLLSASRSNQDFFVNVFDYRTEELEKAILEAANKGELAVDEIPQFTNRVLWELFRGMPEDILRTVYFLDDNQFQFSVLGKNFFYEVYEQVQRKRITNVKRLMIYADDGQLNDPRSIRLMQFHSSSKGYAYRLMHIDDYLRIMRDFRVDAPKGMAIYGNMYVYLPTVSGKEAQLGMWLGSSSSVREYIEFFDGCWNTPFVTTMPNLDISKKLTLDELFAKSSE